MKFLHHKDKPNAILFARSRAGELSVLHDSLSLYPVTFTFGWLTARIGKQMTTRAEARNKRIRELTEVSEAVTEYTLPPEMDEDARALYWVGPWDHRRYVKNDKGKWKKDASGNAEIVIERDPLPAIHIHLGAFQFSPRALFLRRSGIHVAGPHRCIGFLEDRRLLTSREYDRHWHPRLNGWTVNLHILQNAERFGLEAIEFNGKEYAVEYLLTCPPVPRKDSGGYEKNLLLVDPENRPKGGSPPGPDEA